MQPKSILLSVCSFILYVQAESPHPYVRDWAQAESVLGQVRIPVQNPDGHSFFVNLRMGTPLQSERFCVLETNHALSAVFSKDCDTCPHRGIGYDSSQSSTFYAKDKNETVIKDDGLELEGYMAMDYMCIGMYGNTKQQNDPKSTVCNENQVFFLVDKQDEWSWGARATNKKHIDSVCGLGHERASEQAQGWIARAAHEKKIAKNAYSITFVPQKLSEPTDHNGDLVQDRTHQMILETSFLILGGWDKKDYFGDIAWFSAGANWNQNLESLILDGQSIATARDNLMVGFEAGYPYIGMSMDYYYKVADVIKQKNYDVECTNGEHWGVCRAKEISCDDLDLDLNLSITVLDQARLSSDQKFEFIIPLANIAVDIDQSGTKYCQTQMALLPNTKQGIVLGAPFFTSFVGMFDTENERLGFANSMRALPGSAIICVGDSCDTDHTKDGDQTEPEDEKHLFTTAVIFLVGAVLVLCMVICASVCIFKRRTERDLYERRVERRSSKGHKGYAIEDEREDDSSEEEKVSI